jgi:predicted dienelactone hydrolase
MTVRGLIISLAALCLANAAPFDKARADAVGERHLIAHLPSAALRDAEHRDTVRVTVWYPAQDGVDEKSLDIGPSGGVLFYVGSAAPDAPFVNAKRRPVILFSHGYGGTARMMGWFTTNLARAGFVVVAVDHPGNNNTDKPTLPGAMMFWDRADDLKAALAAVKADPDLAAHIDLRRVGVAGYATGGFAALAAAGGVVDLERWTKFCHEHPADGTCAPQPEFPVSFDDGLKALAAPDLAAETARAGDDHAIPEVRAAFAIAPAIVQALTPESLTRLRAPVAIVLGDADTVIPTHSNGGAAARAIPGAELKVLPSVGHYDFVSTCSPQAMATLAMCQNLRVPQDRAHEPTLQAAFGFFARNLGPP